MQTIRPAGNNEHRCIIRDVLKLYGAVVTVGTYINSSQQGIYDDDIIRAVKTCITQHPMLSAIVLDGETEKPQLAQVKTMDLVNHVRFLEAHPPESLQSLLEKVHSYPLPEYQSRLPQWRVYVARSSARAAMHFVFAHSHALYDGLSGLIFHRTLLDALRHPEKLQDFDGEFDFECQLTNELPPSLEQAVQLPISWSFLLRPLLNEYLPSPISRMLGVASAKVDELWTGATARPRRSTSSPPTTAVCVTKIPRPTLDRILVMCRKQGIRLTGLLNHLFAHAVASALARRGQHFTTFIAQTPLDLRRAAGISREQMGNYVSGHIETITVGTGPSTDDKEILTPVDITAIWKTGDSLSKAASTLADQPVGLLKYLSNYRAWTLNNATKPPSDSFSVSNLGRFAPKNSELADDWTIEEMSFSQSADGVGAPLNVNVVSTTEGPMISTATWWPGMLGVDDEPEFAEEVCGAVQDCLRLMSVEGDAA